MKKRTLNWLLTIILRYVHIGIEEICPESEREKRVVEEVVCVWAGEVVTSVGTDGEAAMQKLLRSTLDSAGSTWSLRHSVWLSLQTRTDSRGC